MSDAKDTNPKAAIGATKLPLHLVSPIVKAYQAIAHFLGSVKYGSWNWRPGGARASIYVSALQRHVDRWWEGEELDPVDGTPHLANALACLNILIEAKEIGCLEDDRPPSHNVGEIYERFEKMMAQIKERYKDKNPKHWTIADKPQLAQEIGFPLSNKCLCGREYGSIELQCGTCGKFNPKRVRV